MASTVYRPGRDDNFPQVSYHPSNRASNQIVLTGTVENIALPNGIFWLEQIHAASPVAIADGDGKVIIPAVTSLECEMSPMRCDHGIQITGDVIFLKGFIQEECLS